VKRLRRQRRGRAKAARKLTLPLRRHLRDRDPLVGRPDLTELGRSGRARAATRARERATRSTSASNDSSSCWMSTCPSRSPSRRTSRLSGASGRSI
jgi:hypothetical protein